MITVNVQNDVQPDAALAVPHGIEVHSPLKLVAAFSKHRLDWTRRRVRPPLT